MCVYMWEPLDTVSVSISHAPLTTNAHPIEPPWTSSKIKLSPFPHVSTFEMKHGVARYIEGSEMSYIVPPGSGRGIEILSNVFSKNERIHSVLRPIAKCVISNREFLYKSLSTVFLSWGLYKYLKYSVTQTTMDTINYYLLTENVLYHVIKYWSNTI